MSPTNYQKMSDEELRKIAAQFDPASEYGSKPREELRRRELERSNSLLQKDGKNYDDNHWYKKPVGIVILAVIGGSILLVIKYYCGL
jgi:hypothetical protein